MIKEVEQPGCGCRERAARGGSPQSPPELELTWSRTSSTWRLGQQQGSSGAGSPNDGQQRGDEAAFVREHLEAQGVAVTLVDTGCVGEAKTSADVSREALFELGGTDLATVQARGDRGHAVSVAAQANMGTTGSWKAPGRPREGRGNVDAGLRGHLQ